MLIRDRGRSIVAIGLATVLAVGCSAASGPSSSAKAGSGALPPTSAAPGQPATANPTTETALVRGALLAVGRAGEPDLRVIESDKEAPALRMPDGAPDETWGHLFTVAADGPGTRVTNLIFGEDTGRQLTIPGQWRLPTIGEDAVPVGRSLDNSTLALVAADNPDYAKPSPAAVSRFAIVRAAVPPSDGPLELVRTIELRGTFDFDALSSDGSILFVIEHLADATADRYQVRSVSVASGRMDEAVVVDKINVGEAMAGRPITQLRGEDGTVLTLYRGPEHPFVHLLHANETWAACIDLPANGADNVPAALDWGLAEATDHQTIYAVNATLGVVAQIDPAQLTVARTSRIDGPPTTASGGGSPAIVLAKFGHEAVGRVGRRAVVAPTGAMIIAGGAEGLVAIRTSDLTVAWRGLTGESVRSIALMADARTAFVLLGSGRIVAVDLADGTVRGAVPGEGYDRLVAITG